MNELKKRMVLGMNKCMEENKYYTTFEIDTFIKGYFWKYYSNKYLNNYELSFMDKSIMETYYKYF
jgi:hypothetical protein